MGEGEERERKERGNKRKRSRERNSNLSLNFPAIRPLISIGARGKVLPRGKSFKYRPKSGSFDKLQEVGVLLLLSLFSV